MNGKVITEDKSGQPKTAIALQVAMTAIGQAIVKHALDIPPQLLVQLPLMRDVLREAIAFRKVTEGKQIGWYNPGDKRFCYMDEKEHSRHHAAYTKPVYVFDES